MLTDSSEHKQPAYSSAASSTPTARRARPRLFLKSLFAATVAVLSAEGMLRAYLALRGWTPNCYAAQLQLFRPNAETGYDLAPGFCMRSSVGRISINSLGLRGPEVNLAKPPSVRRIAIVGESSAFGYQVSDGEEAARLLVRTLGDRSETIEVLNGGVPGYNLFQSIVRFGEVLAPLKPDIVIAYLGWNDLPYIVSNEPAADRFCRRPVAAAWERLLSHSTLYGFVVYRVWGGPVQMVPADFASGEPTPAGQRQFVDNLSALATEVERSGARLIVCAQATAAHPDVSNELRSALGPDDAKQAAAIRLGDWLHRTLADFAAERNLAFIDAYAEIPATSTMLVDYVHLTAQGEQRLADLWAEAVEDHEAR
jgi:lysophospholipase L1-like esterase